MSYEFKKISDVEVVESIGANAHVLAEENGSIVKIPASNMSVGESGSGSGSPVVFIISSYVYKPAYDDYAPVNDVVSAYFAGRGYAKEYGNTLPQKIIGFYISDNTAQIIYHTSTGGAQAAKIYNCTKTQLTDAINNYLGE